MSDIHPDNLCESCKYDYEDCPLESKTTGLSRCAVLTCYAYIKQVSTEQRAGGW